MDRASNPVQALTKRFARNQIRGAVHAGRLAHILRRITVISDNAIGSDARMAHLGGLGAGPEGKVPLCAVSDMADSEDAWTV